MQSPSQINTIFSYFNIYRILIALLLLAMSIVQDQLSQQFRDPDIYQFTTLAYLLLNLGFFGYYRIDQNLQARQLFASLSLDIAVLHALFYLGQGVNQGESNLVIISVAAANIMLHGRLGFAIAAQASLFSLAVEIERHLTSLSSVSEVAVAGLQGTVYFASAYIVQNLSQRIRTSEGLAEQQQRDIRELQELNQHVIQSMRTGIIVCDQDGHIKTTNQACQDLLGLAPKTPLPEPLKQRLSLWQAQPNARTTPFRVTPEFPLVQANFASLKREQGRHILIFIEDTRQMKQQAQYLKLASLGRLTASIAHEVRNPLGAISHATQLLRESEQLSPADKKMTDIILRHSDRVNRIIEDTLSLSRRSEPDSREIVIAQWLEGIVNDFELANPSAQIKLALNTPQAKARFDPSQLEQVLVNLLANALRHGLGSEQQQPIILKLDHTSSGKRAFIDVINAGPGIAEEARQHLFEPFFTTETQGTGLGLYLSKEICEANQAQLDYISDCEDGTCFRILFAPAKRIH